MIKAITKSQLRHLVSSQSYFYEAIRTKSLERDKSVSYLKAFVKYSDLRSKDEKFHQEHVYDETLWQIIQELTTKYSDFTNKFTFEDLRNEDTLNQFCEAFDYVGKTLKQEGVIKRQTLPFVSSILSAVFGITPVINESLVKALGLSIKAGIKAIIKKLIEVYDRDPEKFKNAIHTIGELSQKICEGILNAHGLLISPQISIGISIISKLFENNINSAIDLSIEKLRNWVNN